MSIREDIISVKAGLVTLGNAIENITASVDEAPTVTNVDKSINFKGTESNAIYGKGLQWSGYGNTKTFSFQGNPDRIWSSNSIDLHKDASYSIDNTEVINATSLGPTIKSSNLKKVGVLEGLAVNGNINLDSFIFYDAGFMRLGVGTDIPNGQLSVSSNEVEFRVQPNEDNAEIGTYTTASLKIQTDNTALKKTRTYLQVLYDDVIDALKKDMPAEKVIKIAAQTEKDKWILFDRVNPGNVVRTFMRYEWEY